MLPLPDWLTPATRRLPSTEEVAPWIEAIVRIWDDRGYYETQRGHSIDQSRQWGTEVAGARWGDFFRGLAPRRPRTPSAIASARRQKWAVLVPHLNGIEWECEQGLRALEQSGVRVFRRGGSSAIDSARSELLSDAIHAGFESILFIDSDIGFDVQDALRILARPEAVISGVYAKKGNRELASRFADGIRDVVFGRQAGGLYPLKYAAAGFLRIRSTVALRMVAELGLPLCNTRWGKGFWPFFLPIVHADSDGCFYYLAEDWAFSRRLDQIGVTPLADTTIRLWHFGRYGYGWEDAGSDTKRHGSYTYHLEESDEKS